MSASNATEGRTQRAEGGWQVVGVALAGIALIVAVIAMFVPDGESASASGTVAAQTKRVTVQMTEFAFEPSTIEVPAGTDLEITVVNAGTMAHDLKLDGTTGSDLLEPGEQQTFVWEDMQAMGMAWCTVPGHKEAGMMLHVEVTGAPAVSGAAAAATAAAGASGAATIDPQAMPAPEWKPFDPTLAPAAGGTEHEITLHATETVIEVAPGVTQEMWTFGDQVPGPVLRGKVGDLFTITLVNDGVVDHSIDFHASKVAWNDEMRSIAPGESLVYQFEAQYAGMYMYHCGTAPALHHIGNGMYGAIIIEPAELAPVDHEYVLVQSELYLGPQGEPGDLAKMIDEEWDAVVFNGYWNQYKFSPIRVETGERVRVWVLDAGPSENSAFHIVGTVFDTVWKEGQYLLQPDETRGGSQVLDLQPAQGGFVEFDFAEDGLYPIVTHKFANVGKGALGLFQSGEVDASVAGGH